MRFTGSTCAQNEMVSVQISRATLARLLNEHQLVLEEVRPNSPAGSKTLRSLLLEAAGRRLGN
ncbi:hypothetical protein HMF8227_02976 [Saliniradius amylolyticus]|uniref:Uncharacterized protein n=1 Tax=Saliniradius amylolyticus TaxID=2183582 RepID=A0A2S2E6Z7_9ALTE|nr:hypothetical protein [Saliniradius amylolyticus]AWL13424.1 hypothetical protein HMF8227_02976 [Saliniradius amylolyticus]